MSEPGVGQIGLIPKPGNFMARAICWFTRATVFHAIIVVKDDGTCVAANPDGVGYCQASEWPDAIWSEFVLTQEQQQVIAGFAVSQIGKPYNYVADGLLGLHERFGLPIPHWVRKRFASDRSWECAQLCAAALASAGLGMFPQNSYNMVSPGDLYRYYIAAGWVTREQVEGQEEIKAEASS